MKLIGLSGGIASGKSTIAERLAQHGAIHIDADQLAREVVQSGSPIVEEIRRRLGNDMVLPDGSVNRGALGAKVFNDPHSLSILNQITHPAVRALTAERIAAATAADPDAIIVYDVPLLVEANVTMPWDLVVIAEAPIETRIQRMIELRAMTRDEAERRIAQQASDAERRAIADLVIDTGGELEHTLEQADALWDRLRTN